MAIAANSNALMTTTELQTFLNSTISSKVTGITDADYRQTLVNLASDMIEKYCDRIFIKAAYTEEAYSGNNNEYLYLNEYPIDTAADFYLYHWDIISNSSLYTFTVNTEYSITNATHGEIYKSSKFMKGVGNYRVTYTAGYTQALVPYDLKIACAQIAGIYYNTAGSGGIASESIGAYSVSYKDISDTNMFLGIPLTPQIVGVLECYKRIKI